MSDTIHTTTSTMRQQLDYFDLVTAIGNTKIKCVSSAENPSMQAQSGPNTYGDLVNLDSYGVTGTPSSEYEVIGAISGQLITLGTVTSNNIVLGNVNFPVCLGSLLISTQNGSAPTISASGQALFTGATQLRAYKLPAISLSPRHRAQDIFASPLIKIMYNEDVVASPLYDYGLQSVRANFPIEFTTAMPGGVMSGYDLHGGVVTVDYDLNWYRTDYQPFFPVDTTAYPNSCINIQVGTNEYFASPIKVTSYPGRANERDGYTKYQIQLSFPLVGVEAA